MIQSGEREGGDGGMEGGRVAAGRLDSCSASSSLHSTSPELNSDLRILPDSERDGGVSAVFPHHIEDENLIIRYVENLIIHLFLLIIVLFAAVFK